MKASQCSGWIGLCSVLRPHQHSIGYTGDNVLATYTAADHEYTLSEHTAVADGVDWLYLETLSPMADVVT